MTSAVSEREQTRVLERAFLAMFLRGGIARRWQRSKSPRSVGRAMTGSLLIYSILGFFVGISAYFSALGRASSIFPIATLLHSVTFFMLGVQIVSAAGDLLFNTNEADVLAHRPIEPKSLVRAKVRVMVRVAVWLALALNTTGLLVGTFAAHGSVAFLFVHIATIFMEAIFITASVILAYEIGMRLVGREKIDRVVTAIQVVVSLSFILASQMSRELIGLLGTASAGVAKGEWAMALFPPAWFAAIDAVLTGNGNRVFYVMSAIGIAMTCGVSWLAFGKLTASYVHGVQVMTEAPSPSASDSRPSRLLTIDRIFPLRVWLRDPIERAAFRLTIAYVIRNRETKLRIIPGVAPLIVMPFIIVIRAGGLKHSHDGFAAFPIALVGLMVSLVPTLALEVLRYAQVPEASEIFRRAPIAGPAPIVEGTRKAVMVLFGIPSALVAMLVIGLMGSPVAIVLLPGLIALPAMSHAIALTVTVPFSRPIDVQRSARQVALILAQLIVMMGGAVVVSFAWSTGWFDRLVAIEIVVMIAIVFGLRRIARSREWPRDD